MCVNKHAIFFFNFSAVQAGSSPTSSAAVELEPWNCQEVPVGALLFCTATTRQLCGTVGAGCNPPWQVNPKGDTLRSLNTYLA